MKEIFVQNVDQDKSGTELQKAQLLIAAAAKADGQKAVSDQALIEASRGGKNSKFLNFYSGDPQKQGASSEGPSEEPIATGIVRLVEANIEIDLVVAPKFRGQGYGKKFFNELLDSSVALISDTAVSDTAIPDAAADLSYKVWVHGEQKAATEILSQSGFTPTRTLLRLSAPPARAHAAKFVLPAGFQIKTLDEANETQLEQLQMVNAAAFIDHPEQGLLTVSDFKNIMQEEWFDPEDLMLCYAKDKLELAAFAWVKTLHNLENNTKETELYAIGVHPDFSGKGLGSALMEAVFERMATHDPQKISLYVEGDNEPALKVYFKTGFTVATKSMQWSKTIQQKM